MPTPSPETIQAVGQLDAACRTLVAFRRRPVLVMYYPPSASVMEMDIKDAYRELRHGKATKEKPLAALDLLLHTNGGDPVAGYRIAQAIRSLCRKMDVLVPEYAYSAGTLMSFAGDDVRLGDYAGLSPIDITLVELNSNRSEGIQLAGVDSFLEFAERARKQIEMALMQMDRKNSCSSVDSDLLVQMVKEVGALKVGRYYRERTLTGHYAQLLLENYMFKGETDCRSRASAVVSHFLFGAPSHEFHVDCALCKDWHLKITQMPTEESDIAKSVIGELRNCTTNNIICPKLTSKIRMPFIRFYPLPTIPASRRKNAGTTQKKPHRTGNA
jgi:hypothetical protein